MLEINQLVKCYGKSKIPALKGISFKVLDGEVFGLVGKNGAGKSTTIKCLTGIHPLDSGEVIINGHDIVKDPNGAKLVTGYVSDNHEVYENLKGREYLNFMADVYNVPLSERTELIDKYAKIFDLTVEQLQKFIYQYSHGMRQKICLIGALILDPELWILDEPFLGLDMRSINEMKKLVNYHAKERGHIVVFSSHNIDMVLQLCDKVCVISKGDIEASLDMKVEADRERLRQLME